MREFSDLKPFFDIPGIPRFFLLLDNFGHDRKSFRRRTNPVPTSSAFVHKLFWGPLTVIQKSKLGNKRFYCIVIGLVTVFTPPLASCAVIVITFSPVGRGLVKWRNAPSPATTASCPFTITRALGSVCPFTSITCPICTKSPSSSASEPVPLGTIVNL